ncbi:MAG: NADH-quinone oxidoreductase subunit M [Planctomycetota bacterium]|nr:NADH-quinone oxidoreductase subunit M [Planctomycetota bacterium]
MLLTVLTFLPLLGAMLVAGLPSRNEKVLRGITVLVTAIVAVLGVVLYNGFDGADPAAQYVAQADWFQLGKIEVQYLLGVDGLSILLVTLTAALMPFVAAASGGHIKQRTREFLVWLLVMETGMMGVFLSLDVMLFYFFWEVSLVPLYFILGIWGAEKRIYATLKFFLYTLSGSLLMLVAVIAAVYGAESTSIVEMTAWASEQPLSVTGWLFAGFAIAFAIKVPVFPFHTWLADAHTQAPTAGSVILAGVLLKMGTYGLLRFGIAMFPAAAIEAAPVFMLLGAFGIVYGAFLAMAQTDVKRLIACSSVSHLGFVVMGMFALTAAGVRGSVLQMVNHGLSTGLLFLLFGALYERRHSRSIDQYGGLAACVPMFAFFWVFSMLASVGLPGLNGFVGEWLILLGTFQASPWIAAIAVTGVIFGAVYLLMVTRKLLFGPVVHEENRRLEDLKPIELAVVIPLCAACLWIGVAPGGPLGKMDGSVNELIQTLDGLREGDQSAQLNVEHEERAR